MTAEVLSGRDLSVELVTDEPGWKILAGWYPNYGGYWIVIHDPSDPKSDAEGNVCIKCFEDDGTPMYPNIGQFVAYTKHFVCWDQSREELERLAHLPWQSNEIAVDTMGGSELYEIVSGEELDSLLDQENRELRALVEQQRADLEWKDAMLDEARRITA